MRLLEEAGIKERNEDGFLFAKETKQVISFTIEINKSIDYRVTPMQQILKQYGIDMQIKFIDRTTRWKNLMDRNFTIDFEAWGGLIYPNPETGYKSILADQNNNNNIYGFKSDRVDECCYYMTLNLIMQRGLNAIQEII